MPERTEKKAGVQVGQMSKAGVGRSPCGAQRQAWDVAGRINDLINCYLEALGEYIKVYLPLAIIALLLFAVMLFSAYQFLRG